MRYYRRGATKEVESSLTPAQRLTEVLYQVFVPRIYLQTAEAAAFYGSMAQETAQAQKEQEQGDMRVNLPATKMATLFAKGCKPWFITPAESVRLYEDVTGYLKEAEHQFNTNPTSMRFTDTLMENLLQLENFAQWVFDVARPYFPSGVPGHVRGTLAAKAKGRFSPMQRASREQLEEQAKLNQHNQRDHKRVVDELIERKVSRNRQGWV